MSAMATALLAALALPSPAHAQQRDLASAVKATFVTRFASFVEWPPDQFADAADPVVICVAGETSFANLVATAARGEQVGGRSVQVRALSFVSADERCHVLYVGGGAAQSVGQRLQAVRGQSVLTVTDETYGRQRGMIHFVVESGRVRFHVDRVAAENARLNMSSRLLSVALSVRSGSRS